MECDKHTVALTCGWLAAGQRWLAALQTPSHCPAPRKSASHWHPVE
jgi:hypothetical protein